MFHSYSFILSFRIKKKSSKWKKKTTKSRFEMECTHWTDSMPWLNNIRKEWSHFFCRECTMHMGPSFFFLLAHTTFFLTNRLLRPRLCACIVTPLPFVSVTKRSLLLSVVVIVNHHYSVSLGDPFCLKKGQAITHLLWLCFVQMVSSEQGHSFDRFRRFCWHAWLAWISFLWEFFYCRRNCGINPMF